MLFYIPMVLMLILSVISGPQGQAEFKVDIYSNSKQIQAVVIKRTDEGFAGYSGAEEIFKIVPKKDKQNVYDWIEKDGGFEVDLARYIKGFDPKLVTGSQKADLKLAEGLFIHMWREPGKLHLKLDPMQDKKMKKPEEVEYIVH